MRRVRPDGVWSRSTFSEYTTVHVSSLLINRSCTNNSPFTDCNQTYFLENVDFIRKYEAVWYTIDYGYLRIDGMFFLEVAKRFEFSKALYKFPIIIISILMISVTQNGI